MVLSSSRSQLGGRPRPAEDASFEDVTSARIEDFISRCVEEDGIAPKTANRCREILPSTFAYAALVPEAMHDIVEFAKTPELPDGARSLRAVLKQLLAVAQACQRLRSHHTAIRVR